MDVTNLTQQEIDSIVNALFLTVIGGVMVALVAYDLLFSFCRFVARCLGLRSQPKSNVRLANSNEQMFGDKDD
ncbi:hypothetical protein MHM89_04520 [Pseudoalteromonas sp. CNC9-20]|uniref:hypothetical protein n=1 Tax=Pseudoalteromonas TaxID=53246 RepID=UPI001246F9C2|nr:MULTISPECIES: hypothetical protein [Pseudoalteromonas]MCG7569185.1 hypothetical protein [Pseudoalteromonas sp. CNC9-20]